MVGAVNKLLERQDAASKDLGALKLRRLIRGLVYFDGAYVGPRLALIKLVLLQRGDYTGVHIYAHTYTASTKAADNKPIRCEMRGNGWRILLEASAFLLLNLG